MAQTTEDQLSILDEPEPDKVGSWRLHILLEAGYPAELATKLAFSDADLHQAVELVRAGCSHLTAADILL